MTTSDRLTPYEALILAYILSKKNYSKQFKIPIPYSTLASDLAMDLRTMKASIDSIISKGYFTYSAGSFYIQSKSFDIKVPTAFFIEILNKKITKPEAGALLVIRSAMDKYSFSYDGTLMSISKDLNIAHTTITSLVRKGYLKMNRGQNVILLNDIIDWTVNKYFAKCNIK